ncbi:M20/M25/M40 family metallo-hydrolase, partial [Luteitalea sp.]|uniref:M20/M25/M40 family metallo-hydrolase n=1 Tax=Luteitalea sp. TaxID=2004800 RepID=UPI0037CAD2A1
MDNKFPTNQHIRQACASRADWLLDTIAALARIESPSGDVAALDRCGDAIARLLDEAGADVERLPRGDAGAHVRATMGSGPRQVLLLGHFDTVWPIGTLAQMPVEVRDGHLHGPGTFDMKAGLVIAMLAAAVASPLLQHLRIRFLFTTDEEV